jgi:8-oxo-dGTP pyrophosphatase MutT (NUDIX family)
VVTPVPAATVLVLRDGTSGPEVLMLHRQKSLAAFGGYWVFPGGKVDEADRRYAAWLRTAAEDDLEAAMLGAEEGDLPDLLPSLIAAIRETFEETGLLYAHTGAGAFAERYQRHAADWRVALARDPSALETLLVAECARPHWEALAYWTRWLPPTDLPQRFETDFYLACAPEGQQAIVDTGEAVELRWVAVHSDDWLSFKTAPVTAFMLEFLRARLHVHGSSAALIAALRTEPLPPMMPLRLVENALRYAVLPWDAAYPALAGADFPLWSEAACTAMAGLPSRLVIPDDLLAPTPPR